MTEDLYNEIVIYCEKRLQIKKSSDIYEKLDLSHDVICDKSFGIDNYRAIVDRLIYSRIAEFRTKKVGIDQIHNINKSDVEDIWFCSKCQIDLPKSKFQLSWSLCNKCYRLNNIDRIRSVNLKSYYKHHEKRKKEKRDRDKLLRRTKNDVVRAKDRDYYSKNKDKVLARNKRSYEKNREKRLQYLREYYIRKKNENNNS